MRVSPVAISEWDSWGWLDPALGWLGGTGFRERFEREWLYGAFIAACLRLTGSFSGYIIIQQSLGVIAAICMWLTWRTWTALLPKPFILEIVGIIIGLLTVGLYLFSPIALALELSIRPEGIMAFTAFLQLFCYRQLLSISLARTPGHCLPPLWSRRHAARICPFYP